MTSSVHGQIIQMQNATSQNRANEANAKTGSNTQVDSKEFLFLLTQQLQYQDPMNPMDNSQMLAQEAQFATLEQMEALTSNFSKFSSMYQANSLLGQNVEVMVDGKATSGAIEFVDYSDTSGASVSIGGKMYPLDAITKVYPKDTKVEEENSNFLKGAMGYIADGIDAIALKMGAKELLPSNDTTNNQNNNTNSNTQTNSENI